jgi:hypothetical protein
VSMLQQVGPLLENQLVRFQVRHGVHSSINCAYSLLEENLNLVSWKAESRLCKVCR